MTTRKLEESINQLAEKLFGRNNKELSECLRAFAEAVWECNCACNKKAPEPKECLCYRVNGRYFPDCPAWSRCTKEVPAALPDEVIEKIDEIMKAEYQGFNIANKKPDLYTLARLCLSLRKP